MSLKLNERAETYSWFISFFLSSSKCFISKFYFFNHFLFSLFPPPPPPPLDYKNWTDDRMTCERKIFENSQSQIVIVFNITLVHTLTVVTVISIAIIYFGLGQFIKNGWHLSQQLFCGCCKSFFMYNYKGWCYCYRQTPFYVV